MCLEVIDSIYSDEFQSDRADFEEDFLSLLVSVWRQCIVFEEVKWASLFDEYSTSTNESKLEELMKETLLYSVMKEYSMTSKNKKESGFAGISSDIIDSMLQKEQELPMSSKILNLRTRQLFVKAYNLAIIN